MTPPHILASARDRYQHDRAFMAREAPDWTMGPWSSLRAYQRRPYIRAAELGEPLPTEEQMLAELNAPVSEDDE